MHMELDHYVADNHHDFIGTEVIGVERFKPGVCIVTVRYIVNEGMAMMRVYTKDEFVPVREAITVPRW